MSDHTMTAGPTLTNPKALVTVEELRAALDQANAQALQMGELMHRNACVLTRVTDELRKLLTLHIQHDAVGVHDLLSELARKYVRPVQPGQMH